MADDPDDLFVICAVADIAAGTGKAFTLLRRDEAGEGRPFAIFVVRTADDICVAYVNACPHQRIWLNIGDGGFFSDDGKLLECGRHGARFDLLTGRCVEGPCIDECLEAVPLVISDGELCVHGIDLVEEDRYPDPFKDADPDETMEIMIHPE